MGIGPVIGARIGRGVGHRIGAGRSSWTVDAASGLAFPATLAEWSTFIAAKGLAISNPDSVWNCQEASGNLLDANNSLTLTASASPIYRQAITGLTRLGVKLADGVGQQFTAAAGVGPNPATTSQFWLGYIAMPATPSVNRAFWGINNNNVSTLACRVIHNTAGKLQFQVAANSAVSTNVHSAGNHIFGVKYDRAHSAAVLYTDLEKLVGTYNSGVIDQIKGLGSSASDAATMAYGALWTGAKAEAMTDAVTKALYQAVGLSISWS